MVNKYSRSFPSVSRDSSFSEQPSKEPSWYEDFLSNLEKAAVKSKREDFSIFDQINQTIGTKSKYSTVDDVVADLRKRTGLDAFLKANAQQENQQNIFQKIPALKTFIDNYVEERPGTSIEAVVHDLLKIRSIKEQLPDGDDVPEEVKRYINEQIMKKNHNILKNPAEDLQLGKTDLTVDKNTTDDPFSGCMPNRDQVK